MKLKLYIVGTAVLLGFFIVTQSKSFDLASEIFARDSRSNVFQEIMIIKDKNQSLQEETRELELILEKLSDQSFALEAIEKEINRYEKLSGESPIFGPGIMVSIDGNISTAWMVDLSNEFFNSGTEALSINGIRLTNRTAGFYTLPKGQILLNGSILAPPYVFKAIGEPSSLVKILELPGGIFSRLVSAYPDIKINTESREIIQMQ